MFSLLHSPSLSSSSSSSTPSRKRKKTSQIENYYQCVTDESGARISGRCNLCGEVLNGSHSSNYWNHLKRTHRLKTDDDHQRQSPSSQPKIFSSFNVVDEDEVLSFKRQTAELFAVQGFPHWLLSNKLFTDWLLRYEQLRMEQSRKLSTPKENRAVIIETGNQVFEKALSMLSSRMSAKIQQSQQTMRYQQSQQTMRLI